MQRARSRLFSLLGTVILCCMGSSRSALAAPPPRHLDLRPPANTELAASQTGPEAANDYPAGLSRLRLLRIATHGDTFVQRFGREGLPLARLWENHSALLSLGLSPRGKPGLWLLQKTH